MSTDRSHDYAEIDAEVRRRLPSYASDTSFEYHILRVFLMIDREVEDKALAGDMMNEILLAIHGLRESFHDTFKS